jgi:hypothetical protein
MAKQPIPDIAPLPDYLQAVEPVTLDSIRKARKATARGKTAPPVHYENTAVELQAYLNFAAYDISLWIGAAQRHLKSKERAGTTPPEILKHLAEALRELKLCSDIGNFAINQLTRPN